MRGATFSPKLVLCGGDISIHAPHAGRDILTTVSATEISTFQSTRPMRGATIITHTPKRPRIYFNPRAPCGARPAIKASYVPLDLFQSTRPMRGATTKGFILKFFIQNFNPRAPCGARLTGIDGVTDTSVFQSTRPMRGATKVAHVILIYLKFQSTRPMRGATI